MSNSIQIRWDDSMGHNLDESLESLQAYRPRPALTSTIRIKGNLPADGIRAIAHLAREHLAETVSVIVTATWEKDTMQQLRLFHPLTSMQTEDQSEAGETA